MSRVFTLPRTAILLAGVAAGALLRSRKPGDGEQLATLKKSLSDLQSRVANQEGLYQNRLNNLEAKVDEQERRLNDVPSTSQIVAAMETLLAKTMSSLDDRLSSQAHSIDLLKATVSQTDDLLERVLESIDSLRQATAPEEESSLAR